MLFRQFIDVLYGCLFLDTTWQWTRHFITRYMEEQKAFILHPRSEFPEELHGAFTKCYDYIWDYYFSPGARFDVGRTCNYSRSITDGHYVYTNNANETLNGKLNAHIGNAFNSMPRLAEKLRDFYKMKNDTRLKFKKDKTIGVRSKFVLQKFAEQKHIHIKYFRIVSWLLSENVRTEETTTQAYMCFFEASFKLGRITDCDPKVGKNFQKACFDWTELGYPSYFPFVHCEFENA